jgi:hypothetical protein
MTKQTNTEINNCLNHNITKKLFCNPERNAVRKHTKSDTFNSGNNNNNKNN